MFSAFSRIKKHLPLLSALLTAAVLRCGIMITAASDLSRLYRPDTDLYLKMAETFASAGNFGGITGRVPLFPALWGAIIAIFPKLHELVTANILMLFSLLTVYIVYLCAKEYQKGTENIAAWLFALNITSVANAPMLLTDTLFAFLAALQTLFIFKYLRSNCGKYFISAIIFAAVGTLLRPINLLFPLCAIVILFAPGKPALKNKIFSGTIALLLTAAIVLPWMLRNDRYGAGITIDTNTGAMYHQNGAMLLAEVSNSDFESVKAKIISEMNVEFQNTAKYPDEKSREAYRIKKYRSLVLKHPFVWLKQQLNFATLLPDAPTFLELAGATTPNRGTMGVLAKDGVFAAVKHYFNGKYGLIFLLLPLLAVSAITLLGTVWYITQKLYLRNRESLVVLVLFALLIWYYLFLPGAISAPRYHLPVLPCACTFAAVSIAEAIHLIRRRKENSADTAESGSR